MRNSDEGLLQKGCFVGGFMLMCGTFATLFGRYNIPNYLFFSVLCGGVALVFSLINKDEF